MTSKLTREQVITLIAENSSDSALVDALEYLLAVMGDEPVDIVGMTMLEQAGCFKPAPCEGFRESSIGRKPVENHIGSKNALDAIVSFIKSESNPTVKDCEEVSERLHRDNCQSLSSHIIEYIEKIGEELEDLRAEQADDACRAAMLQAGNSPAIPDGSEQIISEAVELLKRAAPAMLADDSGPNGPLVGRLKSPVTVGDLDAAVSTGIPMISDRWIPVSERMPETDGNYWGWWSESKRQGPVWFIKSELQAQFQSSEITHWMPLPAAPQEVKP